MLVNGRERLLDRCFSSMRHDMGSVVYHSFSMVNIIAARLTMVFNHKFKVRMR